MGHGVSPLVAELVLPVSLNSEIGEGPFEPRRARGTVRDAYKGPRHQKKRNYADSLTSLLFGRLLETIRSCLLVENVDRMLIQHQVQPHVLLDL